MRTRFPLFQDFLASGKRTQRCRRRHATAGQSRLEPLEPRVLLSVVIAASGKSATYTDIDGDIVKVAITVGTLTAANFVTTPTGLGDQLNTLDFTAGTSSFAGTNLVISVTTRASTTGDGLANIGYIDATGVNLGTVTVNGDLGRIDAGTDSAAAPALKSLTVRSMGRLGLTTQGTAGTASLVSNINGLLPSLSVKSDVQGTTINVDGSANGKIGAATIAGSVIGNATDHTGEIATTLGIGTLTIGGNLQGGGGLDSGAVIAGGGIGIVSISGNVFGAGGDNSGSIQATKGVGTVTIGDNLRGGGGTFSGAIQSLTAGIGAIKIGGSLQGSRGTSSGAITASTGIGSVSIANNLNGSTGDNSGSIQSTTAGIGTVTIGGSVFGNTGTGSALIAAATNLGKITINGNLHGGAGQNSASLQSGAALASLIIGGSVFGGGGTGAGAVTATSDILKATIGGDLIGGSAADTGLITSTGGQIFNLAIGGSVIGGTNGDTGAIIGGAGLGLVKVGGDVHGLNGTASGFINSVTGEIASVTIGGSLLGGGFNQTGEILSAGNLGLVTIGGSVFGSNDSGSSSLDQVGAIIAAGGINSVTVGGDVIAGANTGTGTLTNNGTIRAGLAIGSLTIKGSLLGSVNETNSSPAIISALGVETATTDMAIGKITIGGSAKQAQILAGYNTSLVADSADAQIGAVTVGGDWIKSDLVAGASNSSGNVNFGDGNDAKISGLGVTDSPTIFSKIGNVTVKGYVYGAPLVTNGPTHFGFVAESIGAFQFGGVTIAAHATPISLTLPGTSDVTLHVIA